MKQKILSLFLLTAILSIAMVSAAITSTSISELSQTGDSVVLTIMGDKDDETVIFSEIADIVEDGKTIEFDIIDSVDLDNVTATTVTITYDIAEGFDFDLENTYSTTLTITDDSEVDTIVDLTFEKAFCSVDNPGELDISNIEFDILEGYGDDEDFWYPLDEIELVFEVENKGDYDVDNIEVKICVLDKDENTCVFDEDDFDLSDDDFNLDWDDDEIEITATLTVDPDELKAGSTNYEVYIKAVGDIDDSNAPVDIDGEPSCISDSEEVEIRTDEEFIIFSDITFSAEPVPCGEEVTLDFEVWNTGDTDLDDDEIYVWIYSKELGIDEDITFNNGIDKLDLEEVSYTFTIPLDAEEKTYHISLKAYDDYSYDDNDLYENEEDDESEKEIPFKVEGVCKGAITEEAQITAELDPETPEAVAGEKVIIKATIKNTGDEQATYDISVSGHSSWSSLSDINPETITLEAGESKDVSIILNLDSDAEGDKEFTIKASVDSQSVKEQKVALTVESSTGMGAGITGGAISEHIKSNGFIYAIVIINLILIIAIISVVRRMTNSQIPAM